MYVVEPTLTLTGAAADHRLAVASRDVAWFAQAIAAALKVGEPASGQPKLPSPIAVHAGWIAALARDLAAHRGKSVVVAGETQSPEVHTLAHLINHALGNVGTTVEFIARVDAGPSDQIDSLRDLVRDANAGLVDTLIILGGNPAYDAPSDLGFSALLGSNKIKLRVHLGLYEDETAQLLPLARPGGPLPRNVERPASL